MSTIQEFQVLTSFFFITNQDPPSFISQLRPYGEVASREWCAITVHVSWMFTKLTTSMVVEYIKDVNPFPVIFVERFQCLAMTAGIFPDVVILALL
jgi:hypothetical protein